MKHLSKRQVLLLHGQLLIETGGADGIRDEGLLESALDSPYSGFDGQEFFPSVASKAARLAFGLIRNHPFVDGNKRIGILAMLVLLDINGVDIEAENAELVALGVALAEGTTDAEAVERWITNHTTG
ncbi:MAG: type II toxin-antitoxin system death-on-curing family toxin [Propionibacteriaceae bacterium]|nr:type II toxin-antitoxin system death-on-curing family toxin [Propionibacteriaceae bacterium]